MIKFLDDNRPLSLGCNVESHENKKLYFCMAGLAVDSRLRLDKHQDSRENKTNRFPRDHVLSV